MLHIRVVCFEHMAAWKTCCDMQKVCGYIFEGCKRHNVWHTLMFIGYLVKSDGYTMIFILYMLNLLKVSECKHTEWVFVMLSIWSLFRCFCKFVFTKFLTTWVHVEIVMFDSRMVISSIYILILFFTFFACTFVYKLCLQTDHHTW